MQLVSDVFDSGGAHFQEVCRRGERQRPKFSDAPPQEEVPLRQETPRGPERR